MRFANSMALLAGVGLGVAGCGSDYKCADLCSDLNKCPGVTQPENCSTFCSQIGTVNKNASCTSSFDDALSCYGDHKDLVCGLMDTTATTSNACTPKTVTWGTCLIAYCPSHTDDPICQLIMSQGGL